MITQQLYEDFTTNLLPKIQEGLVISKDYFMDLAGRYIQYLIIRDSLLLGVGIVGLLITFYGMYRVIRWAKKAGEGEIDVNILAPTCILSLIPIGLFILLIVFSVDNLIKGIYIPEVRIIEEIQKIKSN